MSGPPKPSLCASSTVMTGSTGSKETRRPALFLYTSVLTADFTRGFTALRMSHTGARQTIPIQDYSGCWTNPRHVGYPRDDYS
jgi:hypothetical protein